MHVTLAVSEEGGAYQTFSEALRNELQSDQYELKIKRAEDAYGGADLYIAVGMKAATLLASRDIPTLSVFVPKAGYEKLQSASALRMTPHSSIFLDQPMERQIALLLAALPDARKVGVLYSALPPELPLLRRLLREKNMQLHEQAVDQVHTLNDALEIVLEESDLLLVLPDAQIYNASTIRNILLTSYRRQVPLIGISQAYVKAGALCAIYSTPMQIAQQAAEAVKQFANSRKLPPSQYPVEFEVSVNTQVARSLEIPVKDAESLRNEVRGSP